MWCLSFADSFDLVWSSLGASMLPQMALFHFYGRVIFHCIYVPSLCHVHSSVNGHLSCFHVLATVNSTALNIEVHGSFRIMVLSHKHWSSHRLRHTGVSRPARSGSRSLMRTQLLHPLTACLGQRTNSHAHPGSVGPSHPLAVHRGLRATLTGLPYRTTGNRAAGFTPHPMIQDRAGDHDGSHSVLDTSLRIGHCRSAGVRCSCWPTRTPTLHKPGAPTRGGAHRGQSKSLASTPTYHFADSFITIWCHSCFINTDETNYKMLKYNTDM